MCQVLSQTPHWAPWLYKAKGVIVLLGEESGELISHNLVWQHQQTQSEDSKRKQDKVQSAKVTKPLNVLSRARPQSYQSLSSSQGGVSGTLNHDNGQL